MDDEPPRLEEADRDGGTGSPRSTAVVQLGRRGRAPAILTALVATFLAVAIVKPWPAGDSQPFEPVRPPPTPTAAPSLDPLAVVHDRCGAPRGWRTYTKERWSGGTLHAWMTLEPAAGHHAPIEDVLPVVPYATEILELGFCTPELADERPPAGAALHVWAVDGPDNARRAHLLTPAAAVPGLALPYGDLLDPPGVDPGSAPATWPPGRYVFEIVGPGNGYDRWWAIQVDPPLHPSGPSLAPDGAEPLP